MVNGALMQFKVGNTWVMVDEAFAVSRLEPFQGQRNVPLNSDINIDFNKSISTGTEYEHIVVSDESNNPVGINKSIQNQKLVIDPISDLNYASSYTVTIPAGAVIDNSGNYLAHESVSSFTTRGEFDLSISLAKGWNLISLPASALRERLLVLWQ
ncbi:MAG: Ig-like domain-containing protein [Bacillota bacterium]|nr:Ig-like domain-containing protein [Bacillota bacterium]